MLIILIKSLKNSNIKEKVKITLYKYQIIHNYKILIFLHLVKRFINLLNNKKVYLKRKDKN